MAYWKRTGNRTFKCSCCGKKPINIINDVPEGKYCAYCGSYMEYMEERVIKIKVR